jgi:hypothetical protein
LLNFEKKPDDDGIFRSLSILFGILMAHVVVLFGVGLLIIFFHGIINYMLWLILGGFGLLALFVYLIYRRTRRSQLNLMEVLSQPVFQGRTVELNVLGKIATLKLGQPELLPSSRTQTPLLEGPDAARDHFEAPVASRPALPGIGELSELARLYEKELITADEFAQAKAHLFRHSMPQPTDEEYLDVDAYSVTRSYRQSDIPLSE